MKSETKICKNCGKSFIPVRRQIYCSRKCGKQYNYRKRAPLKEVKCGYCGKTFTPLHKNTKYCSDDCAKTSDKIMSKNRRKIDRKLYPEKDKLYRENNPEKVRKWIDNSNRRLFEKFKENFKETNIGLSEYQRLLQGWGLRVKDRDKWACRKCGSTGKVHAHHILPKSKYPEQSLTTSNGITLCRECHIGENSVHQILGDDYNENDFWLWFKGVTDERLENTLDSWW